MEYTSSRLWCRLAVVAALVLLACSPSSADAVPSGGRKLLQLSLAQQFVVPQSHLRAIHGLRPLKWSSDLAGQASRWASGFKSNCAAASSSGVNVFRGVGDGRRTWQPSDAVAAWAEQADHFDFGAGACAAGNMCAQFEQLMWRMSTQVGCASVQCASGETLMTCHYWPRGNIMG
uniref:Uncharacterized protein n=1 Tax=Avena sativa TaxID=4498 RepID=A0ACD5ZCD5_AVESA